MLGIHLVRFSAGHRKHPVSNNMLLESRGQLSWRRGWLALLLVVAHQCASVVSRDKSQGKSPPACRPFCHRRLCNTLDTSLSLFSDWQVAFPSLGPAAADLSDELDVKIPSKPEGHVMNMEAMIEPNVSCADASCSLCAHL